ncbi:MAG: alpha-amylase family glycosyl hydrolase [Sumerlaeia bacterium]
MTQKHLRLATTFLLGLCLTVAQPLVAQTPTQKQGVGPLVDSSGVAFRVWAPNADAVSVAGDFNRWNMDANPLANEGNGHWSADVPGARAGQRYKYVIRNGTDTLWRTDPRAHDVTNSVGDSVIVDHTAFNWQINDFQMDDWNELIIYEMHIGTFNDNPGGGPGSFNSALGRLDELVELGVNAVKIMPLAEFGADFSWGYNPAHPFAPESAYGSPEQLKRLVDECHRRGIAVLLDVVYNHFGPSDLGHIWCFDGECLGHGGIYFYPDNRANTDWGNTRPDYRIPEVRDWLKDNALYWLNEYRMDGLRFDSTGNIRNTQHGGGEDLPEGWSLLQYINDSVDAIAPGKLIVAEDLQNNEWITKDSGAGGAGFDSQWDAGFVHPVRDAIIGGDDRFRDLGAVAGAIASRYNGDPLERIIYTESHDEVANGKARVPWEIDGGGTGDSFWARKRSTLGGGIVMTAPGIPMMFQGQELLEDEWFQDTDPLDWSRKTTYPGVYQLYKDLIALRRNLDGRTKGLTGPNVRISHFNDQPDNEDGAVKVLAYRRWLDGGVGDDVMVLANLSNRAFPTYQIGVPSGGRWYVAFNSDDVQYGADYDGLGTEFTDAIAGDYDGFQHSVRLPLGRYSMVILTQAAPDGVIPTPTATQTPTPTPTMTPTVTPSPTPTPTLTPTPTPAPAPFDAWIKAILGQDVYPDNWDLHPDTVLDTGDAIMRLQME